MQKWWLQCLHDGGIGAEVDFEFDKELSKESVYLAFKDDMAGDYARVGSSSAFWKNLKQNTIHFNECRRQENGSRCRFVKFKPLEDARVDWEVKMGTKPVWDELIPQHM